MSNVRRFFSLSLAFMATFGLAVAMAVGHAPAAAVRDLPVAPIETAAPAAEPTVMPQPSSSDGFMQSGGIQHEPAASEAASPPSDADGWMVTGPINPHRGGRRLARSDHPAGSAGRFQVRSKDAGVRLSLSAAPQQCLGSEVPGEHRAAHLTIVPPRSRRDTAPSHGCTPLRFGRAPSIGACGRRYAPSPVVSRTSPAGPRGPVPSGES